MIVMIAVIVTMCWAAYVAWDNARSDEALIRNAEEIDHAASVVIRAILLLPVLMILCMWAGWWMFIPLLGVAFGTFTPWFRYALNRMRGKDWRYISPKSNVYDFIAFAAIMLCEKWPMKHIRLWAAGHDDYYKANAEGCETCDIILRTSEGGLSAVGIWMPRRRYAKIIHSAGVAAYIVELTTLALSLGCILNTK